MNHGSGSNFIFNTIPEYWSGLPCPPPGDLLNSGIEPSSPPLHADSLSSEPPGKPKKKNTVHLILAL